ncbi:MAG: aldo/keto reductase [Deltaproteobacteria bacterium]|jgi:predicted aldo/keto reductase-like oxidoreductase|nr:aldo/keto reductase [Deltaproteobacteria bacterium]
MIEKRAMGRTGDSASILGFGCMRLPLKGPKPSDIDYDLATGMLRSAIDRGVSFVDTAYVYHSPGTLDSPGESEAFLSQALKGGYREKVSLSTKLPLWFVNSRADMDKYLDVQLKRLDAGRIDYYLAHGLGASMWPKMKALGLLDFFRDAVKDGRIKYPAFSFHDEYQVFEDVVKGFDWALALVQYNYLDRNYQAGTAGVKLAAERGVAVAVMEPLRGGFLVRHLPEEAKAKLASIRPEWPMAAWAFNWLWSQPEVSVVLSGMSDQAQVDENVLAAQAFKPGLFGEAERKAIDGVTEYFEGRTKVDCTACGYCMPCEEGVDIPLNLGFYNQYHLFDADEARERCRFVYGFSVDKGVMASRCADCGKCVEKCPQHIPIPEFLKKTDAIFAPAPA